MYSYLMPNFWVQSNLSGSSNADNLDYCRFDFAWFIHYLMCMRKFAFEHFLELFWILNKLLVFWKHQNRLTFNDGIICIRFWHFHWRGGWLVHFDNWASMCHDLLQGLLIITDHRFSWNNCYLICIKDNINAT